MFKFHPIPPDLLDVFARMLRAWIAAHVNHPITHIPIHIGKQ